MAQFSEALFLQLDYPTLVSLCDTNTEFNRFCRQDYLWMNKVFQDFGNEVAAHKPENITFREQYGYLQRVWNPKDAIVDDRLDAVIALKNRLGYGFGMHNPEHYAANLGRLRILQWLADHGVTLGWMDLAAAGGHVDIMKWLAERGVPATRKGYVEAIENGHLNVVQYFIDEFDLSPTVDDADWAATYGRLDILNYFEKLGVRPSQQAAEDAPYRGNRDLVAWFSERGY